jgi:Calcineurin-like phosphoesterase
VLVGFIGDVHGRVFHALAAVITWRREAGRRVDLLIQVGDLGAFPDPGQVDEATARYHAADPAEADLSRLLKAVGRRVESLRRLRAQLLGPIYFLRGNHEDAAWLRRLPVDPVDGTAKVDPFDLFRAD